MRRAEPLVVWSHPFGTALKHTGFAAAAFVLVAGLSACGSSGGTSGAGANTSTTTASACVSACATGSEAKATVGEPAPKLAGAALDGSGSVTLASLSGKPTVVVFWSPPCPHCQEEMPKIDALATQHNAKSNFMSVAIKNPDVPPVPGYETPAQAVATMGITMPSIAISRAVADATWGPNGLPTAYVLDQDHKIVQIIDTADVATISNALATVGVTN
jgi:thiol-disulfide isomerase/thioredoxin